MSVSVLFMPDRVTVQAEPGEPLLSVAQRGGLSIPTGCMMGACYACEIGIQGQEQPVRACITAIPIGESAIVIHLSEDPGW
jgi:ferredoxin